MRAGEKERWIEGWRGVGRQKYINKKYFVLNTLRTVLSPETRKEISHAFRATELERNHQLKTRKSSSHILSFIKDAFNEIELLLDAVASFPKNLTLEYLFRFESFIIIMISSMNENR